ncbi:MAG: Kef-type K+ transport system membrane [Desulfobulbaceae bacterium]|nr:MAG: Kef-type K+ transport system membrane [Desulfobulbaceae bacterium]
MTTMTIAVLLAAGLLAAKMCQRWRLPSVTAYILAGLLLGPSGFALVTRESLGGGLDHFSHIALMLIAFGVGEHLELKTLRGQARSVLWIAVCEALGAFILVTLALFLVMQLSGLQIEGWAGSDYLVLSILLGAVAASGSPAVTLLVVRELKAHGPFTTSLLAMVAIDSGLALMILGLAVSLVHSILGQAGSSLLLVAGNGLLEIVASLILGVGTGFSLDLAAKRFKNRGEILVGGLALLLLCSEGSVYLGLSPLLAGMAAGFTLVNRAERDVRLFRALNFFEPPVYVIFFTLVGIGFDLKLLGTAGLVGVVYFLTRICGKILGVKVGGRLGQASPVVRQYMGVALVPQAGVAVGLLYFLTGDPALAAYSAITTPVGLTGVFLSQLFGSSCLRSALIRSGEASAGSNQHLPDTCDGLTAEACVLHLKSTEGVSVPPWVGGKLVPFNAVQRVVVFAAAHHATAGLARLATIFAHYCHALPMAVRVQKSGEKEPALQFQSEEKEVAGMGYPLVTEMVPDISVASGLVAAVEYNMAHAVFLGYPPEGEDGQFQEMLEVVAENVQCPVIVVRFYGELHLERILVPVVDLDELKTVYPLVAALSAIGAHQLELLYLLPSEAREDRMTTERQAVLAWISARGADIPVKVVATDSRVQTIQDEAEGYDLVVMGTVRSQGVKKFFFGSLADAMIHGLQKTLLVVYAPTVL